MQIKLLPSKVVDLYIYLIYLTTQINCISASVYHVSSLIPIIDHLSNFVQHVIGGPTVHFGADFGNDAVTASQQTTVLNFYVRSAAAT